MIIDYINLSFIGMGYCILLIDPLRQPSLRSERTIVVFGFFSTYVKYVFEYFMLTCAILNMKCCPE
jgi:hypothetical protein